MIRCRRRRASFCAPGGWGDGARFGIFFPGAFLGLAAFGIYPYPAMLFGHAALRFFGGIEVAAYKPAVLDW